MIVAIIQARMGSSRLPNKVLMDIDGITSLEYMVNRVNKSNLINRVVIATTEKHEDDIIYNLCLEKNIDCFRGSENDVLDRYYKAALKFNSTLVVRLTSDCPLIDPKVIDLTIDLYNKNEVDYASNAVPPDIKRFPDGSDVEVFSFDLLKKAWLESTDTKEREHVTFFFWKNNNNFKTILLDNEEDWGKYRITVDYEEDLKLVREIIKKLKQKNLFGYTSEVVQILKEYPEIFEINSMHTWGANW